jgi:long-chain fatty acid transport protein
MEVKMLAKQTKIIKTLYLSSIVSLFLVNLAYGAAARIGQDDPSGLPLGHAGGAALAYDATTVFSNPAGLTHILNQELVIGGTYISGQIKYNGSVTAFSPFGTSTTLSGSATSQISIPVPVLYYAIPVTPRLYAGFGMYAPFGQGTDWTYENADTIVRYFLQRATAATYDALVSLGYRVTEHLSLGASFGLEYLSYQTATAIYTGFSELDSNIQGSDIKPIWQIGGLYDFSQSTRLGANFRGQVIHDAQGSSSISSLGKVNSTSINYRLPAIATLSLYHAFHPQLIALGTMHYAWWSSVQNVVFNNLISFTGTETLAAPVRYRNTMDFALGMMYKVSDQVALECGASYDQDATTNQDRNLALPTGPVYVASIGGHYQWTPGVGFDLGVAHPFTKNMPINNTSVNGVITQGKGRINANLASFQVTWDFDRKKFSDSSYAIKS